MANWKRQELVREAGGQFGVLQWITTALTLVFSLTLIYISGTELRLAQEQVAAQLAAGITVYEVRNPTGEAIEGEACFSLNQYSAVSSAGLVLVPTFEPVYWQPGAVQVPVVDVTAGVIAAWVPHTEIQSGIYLGEGLAAAIGIFPGAHLSLLDDEPDNWAPITAMLDEAVIPTTFQSAIVRVTAAVRPAQSCVFRVGQQDIPYAADLAAAVFTEHQIEVLPYKRTDELSVDPIAQLQTNPMRFAPLAAVAISSFVALVLGFTNRRDLAVYRVLGTTRGELWFLLTRQQLWQVLLALTVSAAGAALTIVLMRLPLAWQSLWYVLSGVIFYLLVLLALSPLAWLLGARGKVIENLQ